MLVEKKQERDRGEGSQQRQREIYLSGLKRSRLLYETLVEMAVHDDWMKGGASTQSGKTAGNAAARGVRTAALDNRALDKWLVSFDTMTQDALCVLAPSLCGFVIWVLGRAVAEGKRRLYFMARDGYLMYCLAKVFCKTLGLPVECRYLYCSRYSLRIPAYHLDMEGALDFICRGGIDVTMEKILDRSGISGEDKRKVRRMLCLPYAEDEVIPYAKLKEVRGRLAGCEYFLECVDRNSRLRMPKLEGYLRQEGLLGGAEKEAYIGNDFALVDSGWTGSIQKSLAGVLAHLGWKGLLKGYYFGLYELPDGAEANDYEAYYFGPKAGLGAKVYFSNCLFESVFSAPHGMTVGYEEEIGKTRGRELGHGPKSEYRAKSGHEQPSGLRSGVTQAYVPILVGGDENRCKFAEWMELCVTVYGEKLAHKIRTRETFLDLDTREFCDAARHLFKAFMGRPTRAEAETFGDLKFSDDVLENSLYRTAARLTEEELAKNHVWNKALVMLGIRKGSVKESAWYEGSVARLGRRNRYHWKMYAAYKYLLYIRQAGWKRRG